MSGMVIIFTFFRGGGAEMFFRAASARSFASAGVGGTAGDGAPPSASGRWAASSRLERPSVVGWGVYDVSVPKDATECRCADGCGVRGAVSSARGAPRLPLERDRSSAPRELCDRVSLGEDPSTLLARDDACRCSSRRSGVPRFAT